MPYGGGAAGGGNIGDTITGGTPGSVLFVGAGPVIAQDNANFFFDDATDELRVNDISLWQGAGPNESNTALGVRALDAAQAGTTSNTAIGRDALGALTTGTSNTAVGDQALDALTTAGFCTAIGDDALGANNGVSNTAIGALALQFNTIGTGNTAVGRQALANNTNGVDNVAVGLDALISNITGNRNVAVGHDALRFCDGTGNTALGMEALLSTNTGMINTAIGFQTLRDITSGIANTAIGQNAGRGITSGNSNTIIGGNVTGLAAGLTRNIILADGDGNIRLQIDDTGVFTTIPRYTLTALGGGAAPTFGTIGGAGPATAAQNSWIRVLDSAGAATFIPVWK